MTEQQIQPANADKVVSGFSLMGINPLLLANIAKKGLEIPTPIQSKAIPVALKGSDLIGIAQTGTGKTFAFGIPVLNHLLQNKAGRVLIVLPTRELACQVEENLRNLAKGLGLSGVCLIGGESIGNQIADLRRLPKVLVATPGRLMDHVERGTVKLDNISILILDEADMMFDLGFAREIEQIIKLTPKERQILLFSATMPSVILNLANRYLKSPIRIEVAPAGATVELVDQEIYVVHREDRLIYLEQVLKEFTGSVLIFMRTKHGAADLCKRLKRDNYSATEIHSNLSVPRRRSALASFKSGTSRIMVATDVAARGLDINDIELVLNFDLPANSEDYVHRIGRTARAGKKGKAISFAMPSQRDEIQKIERLIRKNIPFKKMDRVNAPRAPQSFVPGANNETSKFEQRVSMAPKRKFRVRPNFVKTGYKKFDNLPKSNWVDPRKNDFGG